MPYVSIIIPVYNVEKYLKRCLDSVCEQTLHNIEIICIDDCSTDDSLKILQEYAQKDNRITIIALNENSGAAIARNKGLEIAKGEYLGFVDPDDEIERCFYEKLYERAKNTDAEVVKCHRRTIEIDGSTTFSNLNNDIKNNGNLYFGYEWQSAIYKSSLIFDNGIKFPPELIKAQDVAFLLNVMLKTTKPIELVDGVYYTLYRRGDSLNANIIPIKNIRSAIKSCIYQCELLNASDLYNKDKETYFDLYLGRIQVILEPTLFQNPELESKRICAEGIIKLFNICKDKEELKKRFYYKKFIKYISSENVDTFAKVLSKYKTSDSISLRNNFWENIFSIKNSNKKTHKIITLFGIRFKKNIRKVCI